MMGNLFNKYSLSSFINDFKKKLQEDIDRLEITDSSDLEAIIDRLVSNTTIQPIQIQDPIPSKPRETTKPQKDIFGESYKQRLYEVDVTIPFTGNYELFYCHPSSSTVVYLDKNFQIGHSSISGKIVLVDLDPNAYKTEVEKVIRTLNSNLPEIHSEIKSWNDGLENQVKYLLENRKGLVSKKHDFMEQIGLKINPTSDDYIVPNPVTKRKIPEPISKSVSSTKKELVPILQEKVYADIKEVLYNVGEAIERKPSLYRQKFEEDLRDIFLLFLETRYESTSGVGEAFNKKGKTDILLKYSKDGSNLFVAECKFWKGPKIFFKAIDQLLGYLTHRDSKTALMVFVDNKEPSSVIITAKNEIQNHKNFKRHVVDSHDTSIGYEMTLPSDSGKTIQMELIFFHFPK